MLIAHLVHDKDDSALRRLTIVLGDKFDRVKKKVSHSALLEQMEVHTAHPARDISELSWLDMVVEGS